MYLLFEIHFCRSAGNIKIAHEFDAQCGVIYHFFLLLKHWSYCHGYDEVPLLFTVPLMWAGDSRSPISWPLLMSLLSLASFLVRQWQIWTTKHYFNIKTGFPVIGIPTIYEDRWDGCKTILSLYWESLCQYDSISILTPTTTRNMRVCKYMFVILKNFACKQLTQLHC